ncbi:MAG: bifunctional demethylmenaquinone methyltransferase/2-methoxy-6-polyprenyl-1,4-benzoquinol methylase UbiE [Flavobacteriaceae bacterium]
MSRNSTDSAPGETHFGYSQIPFEEKQGLVDGVFRRVAGRYDLMNDLMSGGMHRLWKDALIDRLAPPRARPGYRLLDVAGGTGDIVLRFLKATDAGEAVLCDINPAMVEAGRERFAADDRVRFAIGNAESLPFPDRHFDAYTIAFGIRNVPRLDLALSEAYRVLKPGGHFLCLEFSQVDVPGLDRLYDAFSFNVIPALGKAVAGDSDSYRYLVESIRRFPDQKSFARQISAAGFERVDYRNLTGGIAAIHSGWRI